MSKINMDLTMENQLWQIQLNVSNGMFTHKRVHAIYLDLLRPGNEDVDKGRVALFIHKLRIMGPNSPNTELDS